MSTGIIYSCKLGSSPSLNHGYSLNSLLKHRFLQLFLTKPNIQKIDADDGDGGGGAPTIFPSGQTPSHSVQGSNIPFGNPSLRLLRHRDYFFIVIFYYLNGFKLAYYFFNWF